MLPIVYIEEAHVGLVYSCCSIATGGGIEITAVVVSLSFYFPFFPSSSSFLASFFMCRVGGGGGGGSGVRV
jgi:hypothetical protein